MPLLSPCHTELTTAEFTTGDEPSAGAMAGLGSLVKGILGQVLLNK